MTTRWTLVGDVGSEAGYHVGDEAMLEANLDLFRTIAPGARLAVVSGDPAYSARELGVDAVPRLGFDRCSSDAEREALLEALAPASKAGGARPEAFGRLALASDGLVISGGGNMTSAWPNFIYERLAFCRQAASVRAPVVILGQTIGPELTARHRECVAEMLKLALWVGVREAPSFALALELGVPIERLNYQLDDAAGLALAGPEPAWGFDPSVPWIAVTLHPLADPHGGDSIWASLAGQLQGLAAHSGCRLVFIPHARAAPALGAPWSDEDAGRALARHLPADTLVQLPVLRAREVAALTGRASMVVSSRYHPLVFALGRAVPCVGLWVDEYTRVKLHGALDHYGCGAHLCSLQQAGDGAVRAIAQALWADAAAQRAALRAQAAIADADESARCGALRALVARRGPAPPPQPRRLPVALAHVVRQLGSDRKQAERQAASVARQLDGLSASMREATAYANSLKHAHTETTRYARSLEQRLDKEVR